MRDVRREAALRLDDAGGYLLASAVIDPAGCYADVGTGSPPGQVVKIDRANWVRVGAIALPDDDTGTAERVLFSARMDPYGEYADFGTRPAFPLHPPPSG